MDATAFLDARRLPLGDILVQVGVITAPQLEKARRQEGITEKDIGQVLVALGFTSEDKIFKALSLRLGIPCFQTFEGMIEPEAAALVPEVMARKHLAIPLMTTDEGLTVGMINPVDIVAIDELARHTGMKILPVMTPLPNLMKTFDQVYPRSEKATMAAPDLAPALAGAAEESTVVSSVDALLREAVARKASDIHLEPGEKMTRIRFRVDGLLQDGPTFEKGMETALVARIKILSRLDITETRLPQDGRLRYENNGWVVDIRISTVPSVNGEKVVMRLLDSTKSLKRLADLELSPDILEAFSASIRKSNRIILVTGPTGSGKTTTLYAALAELNDTATNIVTLEDPVEYRIDRMTQIETQSKIGLTFATGLRAILRQDPNVILVGEMRDAETAEVAIQAAITGHRVFSTLHTTDAVTTIHRLITMRIEPFLIAAALGGVMAQRLLRRLCVKCRKPHTLSDSERTLLGNVVVPASTFFDAAGCESCFQTGYTGRIAIHEWLPVTAALRELILQRASVDELRAMAMTQGLRGLQQDALQKAASGLTSLTEVFRVTQDELES
jgi:type IV pilus assembly protein PilB